MTFSQRRSWATSKNRLTLAVDHRIRAARPFIDLTATNPTKIELPYPVERLSEIMQRAARSPYDPDARGLLTARIAVAAELEKYGAAVSPDDLILTASTSEAYAFLFKLFANPGESIGTFVPGYPLLDHLAQLEGLSLVHVPLVREGRWRIDFRALRELFDPRVRAIVAVHPNNPTGSYVESEDQRFLASFCSERSLPLISDEVFFDYRLGDVATAPPAAQFTGGIAISLGGISKSVGLPHWKLGWIWIGGDRTKRREVADALELIADTYLSVATPVQQALPELFALAPEIREVILARVRANLAALESVATRFPAVEVLRPEGGWSAVLRVPRVMDDEALAIELLETRDVLVFPGYFFDFRSDGYLVVSLLGETGRFAEGSERIMDHVSALILSE